MFLGRKLLFKRKSVIFHLDINFPFMKYGHDANHRMNEGLKVEGMEFLLFQNSDTFVTYLLFNDVQH